MLTFHDLCLRLLSAILLGALIGIEREQRERPAGLRTHIVVALASALFMIVSIDYYAYQTFRPADLAVFRNDPGRIGSYVVAGIGFLGAGAIMRNGNGVKGLTTAATIWLVAALGIAAGAGMHAAAWASGLLGLFTLLGLRAVERSIDGYRHHPLKRQLRVSLADPAQEPVLLAAITRCGAMIQNKEIDLRPGASLELTLTLRMADSCSADDLLLRVAQIPSVSRVALGAVRDAPADAA